VPGAYYGVRERKAIPQDSAQYVSTARGVDWDVSESECGAVARPIPL